MNKIIFISGGARSGKSKFAEELADFIYNNSRERKKIAYLATAVPFDEELRERIKIHKAGRREIFETYEAPVKIDEAVKKIYLDHDVILLECLSTWMGNVFHNAEESDIEALLNDIIENIFIHLSIKNQHSTDENINEFYDKLVAAEKLDFNESVEEIISTETKKILIIVSNETGQGIVPDNEQARRFIDVIGRLNQKIASHANFVYNTISGIPRRLK
jgi:adenosylcobinamide kinase / adenosylcobinamide-phosphate guanylyltransferase